MSKRLHMETARVRERAERGDPFWPAQVAVALAIGLNLLLSKQLKVGPGWVLPAVEAVLLVVLIVVAPSRLTERSRRRRHVMLTLIALVSLSTVVSLGLLVHYLITGGKADAHHLISSGVVLWVTNVLLFAVWYWELDAGGPVERHLDEKALPDFQFPQMENPQFAPPQWRPGFFDYLYTSLTNATAFSPTDTMPLTITAKTVMGVQSVAALTTIALVLARAVNVIG